MTGVKKWLLNSPAKLWSILWAPIWKVQQSFAPIVKRQADFAETRSGRAMLPQNIFGFSLMLYLLLDTVYYLATFGYDPGNPMIYHHLTVSFMPVFVRRQNEIGVTGVLFVVGVYSSARIFNSKKPLSEIALTPIEDGVLGKLGGQTIDRLLSRKLLLFWNRIKPKLRFISFFIEISLHIAYAVPHTILGLYRVIALGRFELRYWWLGLVGVTFHHYGVAALMSTNMFVVVNLYLNIRQKHYLEKIKLGSYRNFELTLATLLEHLFEIKKYNDFYSIYVSLFIYVCCFISSSLFYGAVSSTDVSLAFKIPMIIIAGVCVSVLPSYTIPCSRTNQLNRKLFFKLRTQQISICSLSKVPSRRRIVRLDLMNEYKIILLKPCFRLVTSSPLNSKYLIFELLGFLSVVFMKIITRTVF